VPRLARGFFVAAHCSGSATCCFFVLALVAGQLVEYILFVDF
jgi:hypothetical protein